jgi:glycosyltransferase involved in cell wall biosynthesis
MKILFIQHRFHPNSIGIVRGLIQRGHSVKMVVHGKGSPTENYTDLDPECVPYDRISESLLLYFWGRSARHRYAFPSLMRLWNAIHNFKPDVVILKQGRLTNVIASIMAAIVGSRRILLTNSPPRLRETCFRKILFFMRILPSIRITTSACLPGALSMEKVNGAWYRPYPIEVDSFENISRPINCTLRLLMVGKFSIARKRLHWLIQAADAAGLDKNRTKITIVGSGKEGSAYSIQLRELAHSLGWAESLTLLFNVPQSDMKAVYIDHDIFVMTARDEPFGMVVIEAMAYGLAVICSDTVGASDCITHGQNGLIYASDDFYQLKDQLQQVAKSQDYLNRLGSEAQITIRKHCSPNAFAELVERVAMN